MIKWQFENEYFRFYLFQDDKLVPVDEWESFLANEDFVGVMLLKELIENGQAYIEEDSVIAPQEEICALSSIDQQLLNLPPQFTFDIRIDSDGTLNAKDFAFRWGFYEHPKGRKIKGQREGPILKIGDEEEYLLSNSQLQLCKALDEFNSLPENLKSYHNNLLTFSEIKKLSRESAAILDEYLNHQEVIKPDIIRLRLQLGEDDSLIIQPEIDNVDHDQFAKRFKLYNSVQDIYTIEDEEGKRKRVVFSPEQIKGLKKIKDNEKVYGKQKEIILQNPEKIFDDEDVFDLDSFSKRVVEIGLYKPRFYPFISPYRSKWIPGLLVEETPEERKKIIVKSEKELEELKHACIDAEETSGTEIIFKGYKIPLVDAKKLLRFAEEQFFMPRKPNTLQEKQDTEIGEKCLIIYENIEELEYKENELKVFRHSKFKYDSPPNLSDGKTILDHQKEGIAWLQYLYEHNLSGALLADDMGLGKTLQVLGFIEWHNINRNKDRKPYLIVAPVVLLENWEVEYDSFFQRGSLEVYSLYGSKAVSSFKSFQSQDNKLCLTTYETLRRNQFLLGQTDWAVVVLDEAQKIKTPGTLITNASKALKADFKVAVTGTPVENTLIDLWCIMDFTAPGLLGSAKDFKDKFQNPLKEKDTDVKDLGELLRQRIGYYIQRRLKNQVSHQLPRKQIEVKETLMPNEQLQYYMMQVKIAQQEDGDDKRGKIFSHLLALRTISDHPYLLDRQISFFSAEELVNTSAKLSATIEILDMIKSRGEKAIIFAESRKTQQLLKKVLYELFALNVSIINGATPVKKAKNAFNESRQTALNHFQKKEGFNIIIMSPLAAGFGLNITEANHVIHYSRLWNPAKEDQATDRVYRIGQKKDVFVYYPMAVAQQFDTFDVILHNLLERKRELADASLFPTDRIEVEPLDVFKGVSGISTEIEKGKKLTINDLDTLEPFLFEAAVATLWERQGYNVILTPKINDRGADVVAFSTKGNHLIQVKQSINAAIGNHSVGEVLKAKGYYSEKYNTDFSLVVITNQYFTANTHELAQYNNIFLIDRDILTNILEENNIRKIDIYEMEQKRVEKW